MGKSGEGVSWRRCGGETAEGTSAGEGGGRRGEGRTGGKVGGSRRKRRERSRLPLPRRPSWRRLRATQQRASSLLNQLPHPLLDRPKLLIFLRLPLLLLPVFPVLLPIESARHTRGNPSLCSPGRAIRLERRHRAGNGEVGVGVEVVREGRLGWKRGDGGRRGGGGRTVAVGGSRNGAGTGRVDVARDATGDLGGGGNAGIRK